MASTDIRGITPLAFNQSFIRAAWDDARKRATPLYIDIIPFSADEHTWTLPAGIDGDAHIPWDECDIIVVWLDGARAFPDRRAYFEFGRTLGQLPLDKTIFVTSDHAALMGAYPDLFELRHYMILDGIATPQDAVNLLARTNRPPEDYGTYLASAHWRAVRERALEAAGGRCQLCNGDHRVTAHHRTYERLGHEEPGDLIVLCASCHGVFHGRLRRDGE